MKSGGRGEQGQAGRWLEGSADAGAQAVRRALDEASAAAARTRDGAGGEDQDAFARQRIWNRVQAPWFSARGGPPRAAGRGWLRPFLVGVGLTAAAATVIVAGADYWRGRGPAVATAPAPAQPAPSAPEVVPLPARPGLGGALTTGPDERVRHRLARGVDAELSPRTALVPGDDRAAPDVRVGRVRFSVPHQPPGQRYSVRAGAYQVVVLGTVFDVAVEASGVEVQVTSGLVEVQEAGTARTLARVAAGSRWSSAAAPPPPRRAPPRRVAMVDRDAERTLDQAGELRRRDPRRALAAYRRMLAAGGPLAEVAQYEIGVIEDEDLREPRQAVGTWETYRRRYPQGLLRAEADLSVIDALMRLGERARALEEARAFLQRHPASERRGEVARVAGDLARERGDCKAAVALYDQALSSRPAPDDDDDASFHRAACLGRTGQAGGDLRATAALRAYLARFPLGRHAGEAQRLLNGELRPASPGR